jgi:hypothetical protein
MTITNQNYIHEEMKSRLDLNNAATIKFRIVCFLHESMKIKMYKTIILPVVLYGCETSFLTLREEWRLSVFENGVLRRISGPK